ncbi:hypothetical protein [Enterobacter hormaechei]|uniref:hypothetical protein n=1 Tax=Enterobacter cloacae complex TaxID=354276 RepID=UPI00101DFCAB|nr:hypothetical protein [Enterobacter hormaechei]EKS6459252.1 hypothetical protein [Enterobacter hormaechei]ELC6373486.1 hypothetical protein [Enterobacter hormaechei]ELC6480728.1 hypothetical protein [Enterobacter hormaechei]ELC6577798.1 hypothetical protein [Enterobacter hormaechei]MCM8067623.1 hypothetical protein [Enterobacter hormaechei]
MKVPKLPFLFISVVCFCTLANEGDAPAFKEHNVLLSHGPFKTKIHLTYEQLKKSETWKNIMQKQLTEKANFAGHYRLYISENGELPKDCGVNGWVCGWVVDKITGAVVSELPAFNGNTKYYSTIDNGTPSPALFSAEFYPNSNLIWISGENIPESKIGNISLGDKKCSNSAYLFNNNSFHNVFEGECEIDAGG